MPDISAKVKYLIKFNDVDFANKIYHHLSMKTKLANYKCPYCGFGTTAEYKTRIKCDNCHNMMWHENDIRFRQRPPKHIRMFWENKKKNV